MWGLSEVGRAFFCCNPEENAACLSQYAVAEACSKQEASANYTAGIQSAVIL